MLTHWKPYWKSIKVAFVMSHWKCYFVDISAISWGNWDWWLLWWPHHSIPIIAISHFKLLGNFKLPLSIVRPCSRRRKCPQIHINCSNSSLQDALMTSGLRCLATISSCHSCFCRHFHWNSRGGLVATRNGGNVSSALAIKLKHCHLSQQSSYSYMGQSLHDRGKCFFCVTFY